MGANRANSHLIVFVFYRCVIAGILIVTLFSFLSGNISYGVEPFALILSPHVADHHYTDKFLMSRYHGFWVRLCRLG
jgi:hypothetical protein